MRRVFVKNWLKTSTTHQSQYTITIVDNNLPWGGTVSSTSCHNSDKCTPTPVWRH